ncbi:MAG: hypothetical protein LUG50_06725 [Planctomycetaceae bacterium]|nr:hypothetical protein [Planctomycetaceae bacterium]
MITKYIKWIALNAEDLCIVLLLLLGLCMTTISVGVGMAGCATSYKHMKAVEAEASANAIPAAIQSYEVPIADTSTIPDMLYLRSGQSAVLQEDIVGVARIPAQGDELYTGLVVIQRGSVVIKPKAEP